MQRYLKKLIVTAMLWTGIIRLLQFIHRNEIVIWTIHGVMDDEDNPPWKPLMQFVTKMKKVVGVSRGQVIRANFCQRLAPSMSAAS